MSAISPNTHRLIKSGLQGTISGIVAYILLPLAKRGMLRSRRHLQLDTLLASVSPFYQALLPAELQHISAIFEEVGHLSLNFEECARLIALEHHQEAHRGYAITGMVSLSAINEIERQVSHFERAAESGVCKPDLKQMVDTVLSARSLHDLEERTTRADLYVLAYDGTEYFFEMKSPDPNKGQCLEVTQRILRFHLVRGQPRPAVHGYFAMAYNPDGPTRQDYKWSIARTYMPFEQAVIIGQEFWNIIGGPTTYKELLEIYQEVGQDKAKHILDSLAFGF